MIKSFAHRGLEKYFYLHQLKGKLKELWSVKVSGNWRIIFKFINGNAYIVDYKDYH